MTTYICPEKDAACEEFGVASRCRDCPTLKKAAMTTEPKMPEALTSVQMNHIIGITRRQCGDEVADKLCRLHERVAGLERVLDVALEVLDDAQDQINHLIRYAGGTEGFDKFMPVISAIDAARSKEQGK